MCIRDRIEKAKNETGPSVLLRLRKVERQPSSREGKDGHPRLKNRERPGCRGCASLIVREMAVETEEQREARLQRMSANQHDRLAAEQREARLQHDRERLRNNSHSPHCLSNHLCKQRCVTVQDVPTCTTCSKGFPGLKFIQILLNVSPAVRISTH